MIYEKGEFGIFPAKLVQGLSPTLQTVLSWLIFHTNSKTGTAFPSHATLCKECGIKSRTTVISALDELEKLGFIKVSNRIREGGGFSSNEYSVFIKRKGDTSSDEQPLVHEMDNNQKKEEPKDIISELLFKECWRIYGHKGNKRIAKRYWDKLSPQDRASIRERMTLYINSREHQYRKDFQGWINPTNRMWEDEIKTPENERIKI